MKVKTAYDELEIPKAILDRLDKKVLSEPVDMEVLIEALDELYENLEPGIISKEEAKFWASFRVGCFLYSSAEGGYPIEGEFTFVDGDTRYTVLAFGWCYDDRVEPDFLVYKEPV